MAGLMAGDRRLAVLALALLLVAACSASSSTPSGRSDEATTPSAPSVSVAPAPQAPAPEAELIRIRPSHAPWTRGIDVVVGGADVSVAVGAGTRIRFLHLGDERRIPASTQKLLTSMAALETWGPSFRFPTTAVVRKEPRNGVVAGDLFVVGSGDPELDAAAMSRLAERIRVGGVRRIEGAVVGDTGAFTREWWAPGWVPGLSRSFVNRTTALAFEGNGGPGAPELAAAAALNRALEATGIGVGDEPETGELPSRGVEVAAIRSAPLSQLLATQNHGSVNFYAETLLKAIGADATGQAGSTATGAQAVQGWAADRRVRAQVRDGSGLSYENRVSVEGLVTLLLLAARAPWGEALASSLPGPGEGTIGQRLTGLPVRAKTGTLFEVPVSSLAGYVTDGGGDTVAFAVISRGIDKSSASRIEDEIVRVLAGAHVA
jgi:D-alanyl-D-alanine carboxypeptidase/D-alanyl-D-alanine-endopeptidase (penicillin-binding protein 4)